MNKSITTVLEITQRQVKLIQSKDGPAGKIITAIHVRGVLDTADESVVKAIKELISESKIKVENLICVIARSSTIVRNLKLPSHDPAELEDMLDFQIKQQIPYAKEDIISDYILIGKETNGYSNLMLVTVHKSVVERYLKILDLAGVSPDVFSLSCLGIGKWYNLYRKKLAESETEAVILLDIDNNTTDLCFCYRDNLIFSRSVSIGLNDINSEKIDGFIEQMHLTLSSYRKEKNNPNISKIVILSQSNKLIDLSQKLKTEFSLTVEVVNPLDSIEKDKGFNLLIPVGLEEVSFTASLGLALNDEKNKLNLLPDDVHERRKAGFLKKEILRSCILLISVIAFILLALFLNIYKKQNYLKQIEAKLEEIGPSVNVAQRTTERISLIRQQQSSRGASIDIIYELYNILPVQMSLNVFSLDEKGNVTLQGVSNQMSDVFSFQSSLEKSQYFKNIEVKYASKRKTRQGEMTDFRIICQVNR